MADNSRRQSGRNNIDKTKDKNFVDNISSCTKCGNSGPNWCHTIDGKDFVMKQCQKCDHMYGLDDTMTPDVVLLTDTCPSCGNVQLPDSTSFTCAICNTKFQPIAGCKEQAVYSREPEDVHFHIAQAEDSHRLEYFNRVGQNLQQFGAHVTDAAKSLMSSYIHGTHPQWHNRYPQQAPRLAPQPGIESTAFGQWDDKRDRIFSIVLGAEEFLGRMAETDAEIRYLTEMPNGATVNHLQIQKGLGLRGHLQDELLRIEKMLAADDPKLKCLEPFRKEFPHVVAKLEELQRAEVHLDQVDVILPPSTVENTGPNKMYPDDDESEEEEEEDDDSHQSSHSSDNEVQTDPHEVQQLEDNLKKRHVQEEELVAKNYADRLAEGHQVQSVLDNHALAMQALRRRQEQERDQLKKQISEHYSEKRRRKLAKRQRRDAKSRQEQLSGSSDEFSSDDEEDREFKETLWKSFQNLPPEDFQSAFEEYTRERQSKRKMKEQQSMTDPLPDKESRSVSTDGRSSVMSAGVGTGEDNNEATQLEVKLTSEDQKALKKLFKGHAQTVDSEAAARLLAEHASAMAMLLAQRLAGDKALDEKMKWKLENKKRDQSGQGHLESSSEGYASESSQNSSADGSVTRIADIEMNSATQQKLEDLQKDFDKKIRKFGSEISQKELQRLLKEYRQRQVEIILQQKQKQEEIDDKIMKKLKEKKMKQSLEESQQSEPSSSDLYGRLQVLQEKGSLGREQFEQMLSSYMKVKEKEEKRQRRKQTEAETEEQASSILQECQAGAKHIKNLRKIENESLDAKLQQKLQARKQKQKSQTPNIED